MLKDATFIIKEAASTMIKVAIILIDASNTIVTEPTTHWKEESMLKNEEITVIKTACNTHFKEDCD